MENQSILNKTSDQLTVAEVIKVNTLGFAITLAIGGVFMMTPAAVEAGRQWNCRRKLNKNIEVTEA